MLWFVSIKFLDIDVSVEFIPGTARSIKAFTQNEILT